MPFNFVGVPSSVREKLYNLKEEFVLASLDFNDSTFNQKKADVISPVIPLSLGHRCLRYSHLVWGPSALVVAYITDFYEPYNFNHYLATHGKSPFVIFSNHSVNLPIGLDFKVNFFIYYINKSLYIVRKKSLVTNFISDMSMHINLPINIYLQSQRNHLNYLKIDV